MAALAVGESTFSLLLQPQGKVDAWLRVTRIDDDAFALDVDAGWGEHVLARLRRFLLRVKVELEAVDWPMTAVLEGEAPVPDGAWRVVPELGDGFDLLNAGLPVDADEVADYDERRIRAAVPRMGSELDESTIPASAGIVDRSVSFTKGCYTGQELVARIDSRGDRVPTKLRRITGSAPVGATLVVADKDVGRVTSTAAEVGLAYVRREVELPTDAVARWDGGESRVRIEA
ncbi:MAG: hypothetical protein JWN67_464 [Actinomycetia bacterium]|nr:hypothetical protein [Actinomycetes bacterium]